MSEYEQQTTVVKYLTGTEVKVDVQLPDGSTGTGRSGGVLGNGNEDDATRKAVEDAKKK